jgi:hypothetical protein
MTLAHRSAFGSALVHASSGGDAVDRTYLFRSKGGTLTVYKHREPIIETDGLTFARTGLQEFKVESRRLKTVGLTSDTNSLRFDWTSDHAPYTDWCSLRVHLAARPEVSVRVSHHRPVGVQLRTAVRVDAAAQASDPAMMRVCLAFFWMRYEAERRSST